MKNLKTIMAAGTCLVLLPVSAFAETRDYDVGDFSRIKVAQGIEANVRIGESISVSAQGPDGKMDKLDISVQGDELVIRRKRNRSWGWNSDSSNFEVTITAISLSSIDVSSGADVSVTGLNEQSVSLDASSGASMDVAGVCESLSADASSGSRISADNLQCKQVSADVSSGAAIDVYASDRFTGDASSGGDIDVFGNPEQVLTDESSGGDIDLR